MKKIYVKMWKILIWMYVTEKIMAICENEYMKAKIYENKDNENIENNVNMKDIMLMKRNNENMNNNEEYNEDVICLNNIEWR